MRTLNKSIALFLVMVMLTAFATLFANAEAANTLTFSPGDAQVTVLPDTVESDEVIKVTLTPASASDKSFSYWADSKGNRYNVGDEITVAGKVTLTAVWDVAHEKQPNTFWQLILRIIDFFRTLFKNI